ncbi:MAG TPA: hypothetical protein DD640_06570, partial [Clostridiales bacterium]|nr:hypothetical protein [Clostridiales bacterium]
MTDLERSQRDKATILAIIKYLLYILITAAVVYLGFRLILILLPFVIGLVLARFASKMSALWLDLVCKIRRRRHLKKNRSAAATSAEPEAAPGTVETESAPAGAPGEAVTEAAVPAEPEDALTAAEAAVFRRQKRGRYPHGHASSRQETRIAVIFYMLVIILLIGLSIGVVIGGISQLRSLVSYLPGLISGSDINRRITDLLESLSERFGGLLGDDFLQYVESRVAELQQQLVNAMPSIAASILNGIAAIAS